MPKLDRSLVRCEWIEIPMQAGGAIHAMSYRDARDAGTTKPYIIVTHGAGGKLQDMEPVSIPCALAGFHVISFNQSGHGDKKHRSSGNGHRYPVVMQNIHDVVPHVLQQPDLAVNDDQPRIGFVGASTGGVMALTQAYLNPAIKVTVALSGVHDFMALVNKHYKPFSPQWGFKIGLRLIGMQLNYTEEENRTISPKYCLRPDDPGNASRMFFIHAIDDVLPVEEARANQALAGLPDANCLYLGKGGHGQRGQQMIALAVAMRWLCTYL
jgi:predicted alpha/beta-fold hydrolase